MVSAPFEELSWRLHFCKRSQITRTSRITKRSERGYSRRHAKCYCTSNLATAVVFFPYFGLGYCAICKARHGLSGEVGNELICCLLDGSNSAHSPQRKCIIIGSEEVKANTLEHQANRARSFLLTTVVPVASLSISGNRFSIVVDR